MAPNSKFVFFLYFGHIKIDFTCFDDEFDEIVNEWNAEHLIFFSFTHIRFPLHPILAKRKPKNFERVPLPSYRPHSFKKTKRKKTSFSYYSYKDDE
jgi:hypothetical protein